MVQELIVVVTGSTGKQGGAVTRDPNSGQGKLAANAGATLVVALEDTAAIRERVGEDAARMYEWLDRLGFAVDRAALHREFPDAVRDDFESWAKTQDWNALRQST